jgi:nitrite reductase (NADH) large subunit
MSSQTQTTTSAITDAPSDYQPHIVVVGAGPVGVRFCNELLKREPNARITLFGNEKHHPYNRVQLSMLLAKKVAVSDIELELPSVANHPNFQYLATAITDIDPVLKRVNSAQDETINFDKLVLATGATPHVPNIPGLDQRGVYTLRSLKDAESLYARIASTRHILIVGGGLLGIEAAAALKKYNTEITLVQQGDYLMNRQLDETAAGILQKQIEDLGIRVIVSTGVRQITGEGRVTGVILRNRALIECDTVLFCSGISPNIQLGRSARLKINRGILIDEQLKTSNESIYAIGECSEYEGTTYGIVSPGYEQASVLGDVLAGGSAQYSGSTTSSTLKVIDQSVISLGNDINQPRSQLSKVISHTSKNGGYRKIIFRDGQIEAAVGMGEWNESNRIQESFTQGRKVSWWRRMLFRFTGRLWPFSSSNNIDSWPEEAIVCQCNCVAKRELIKALSTANTVQALGKATNAGTTCGSCKPLLQQLLGSDLTQERARGWKSMTALASLTIILAGLLAFVPGLKVGESVHQPQVLEWFWNDKYWKQVSGFTLLGIVVFGMLMSFRKHFNWKWLGAFDAWRIVHLSTGLIALAILFFHTGLHLGSNLNQLLIINFLLVAVVGAISGLSVALGHYQSPAQAVSTKKWITWAHILVTWPLPVLLATHIFTVYFY